MDSMIAGAVQQQQATTALKVQMAVLQKNMSVQKEVGEMLVGLIETAAPSMQTPGKTVGLGSALDMYA